MSISKPSVTYIITNARIVAVLEGGGAIVETHDIEYDEGRTLMHDGPDIETPQLGFRCSFTIVGSGAPDKIETNRTHLVIEGDCEGQRTELRGDGYFGYTGTGDCEGSFISPPAILLEREPKAAGVNDDDHDDDEDEQTEDERIEEWLAYVETVEVLPSEQFRRAQRAHGAEKRVLLEGSYDED